MPLPSSLQESSREDESEHGCEKFDFESFESRGELGFARIKTKLANGVRESQIGLMERGERKLVCECV